MFLSKINFSNHKFIHVLHGGPYRIELHQPPTKIEESNFLPETNSSHLPGCAIPKGNDRLPTIHFQVRTVSFRECNGSKPAPAYPASAPTYRGVFLVVSRVIFVYESLGGFNMLSDSLESRKIGNIGSHIQSWQNMAIHWTKGTMRLLAMKLGLRRAIVGHTGSNWLTWKTYSAYEIYIYYLRISNMYDTHTSSTGTRAFCPEHPG